jgi:hypothetical protein
VIPNQEIAIQLSFAVNMSIGASATLIRDGNIVPEYPREEGPPQEEVPLPPVFTSEDKVTYRLVEWTGPEDLHTLCNMYLAESKRVVADGQAKGYLTA